MANLRRVTIHDSVTNIEDGAFFGCSQLTIEEERKKREVEQKKWEEERKEREQFEKRRQFEDADQRARRLEIMRRANIECLRDRERIRRGAGSLLDDNGEPIAPLKFIITVVMVLIGLLLMKSCSR